MARGTGVTYMEHPEHGMMPVSEEAMKKLNEKNGWKVCAAPGTAPEQPKRRANALSG